MKSLLIPATAISIAFAAWTDASAQQRQRPDQDKKAEARKEFFRALLARLNQPPTHYVAPGHGYGYDGGYGDGYGNGNGSWGGAAYTHAATVGESYARGIAAMTEAQGRYNRDTAEANVLNEEAKSRALDNWRKAIDTYFNGREANRKYRDAEEGPRITLDTIVRLAKGAVPDRLSPGEWNVVTGEIAWPLLLQNNRFADVRGELDGLFALQARNRTLTADEYEQVEKATETMLKRLRETVDSAKPMDYAAALRFLESLAYEARLSFSSANRAG
jgi:hypothetical protein